MSREQMINNIVTDILATANSCYEFNCILYLDELAEKYKVPETYIKACSDEICLRVGEHESIAAIEYVTEEQGFYVTFYKSHCIYSREDEEV